MAAQPYAVTVTTTATRIVDFAPNRKSITIANAGTGDIFLGVDSSLTSTNGIPLAANEKKVIAVVYGDNPEEEVWALTSSGTQNVRIQETYP